MPEAPILSATAAPEPAASDLLGSVQSELPLEPDPIAPPQIDPALQTPPTGQLLLGTDKRNPVFTVYRDDSGERLLVYYGFELIEIVNNDSADPSFKLLLARLYNARVKLSTLCETFQVDPKTIRRWGKALLQGDAAQLVRVLEGRGVCHKLTPAVENFARLRWPHLVAEGSYGAVGRLLQEIQSVFNMEISRSGLQGLIRILKGGTAPEPSSVPEEDPPSRLASSEAGATLPAQEGAVAPQETRETSVKSLEKTPADKAPVSAVQPSVQAPTLSGNNAPSSPFFPKDPAPALYWCDHAGVLVFAAALAAISQVSPTPQKILAQWLAALLLGAQNIEQTKYLNWEDLELILGQVVRFPTPQREQLKALAADSGLIDELWRFNQKNLGSALGSDFYFDPHTKHYTGEQNVLKGWCPKIRSAAKVLHSDFIHTVQGAPIYFETTDNFVDLRQRFYGVIGRARQALHWPADIVPTYVVDRGCYGGEFFEKVTGDPTFHLITWEKGCRAEAWDPAKVMGRTTITRYRNDATDVRLYRFEYVERAWEKNPLLRQIMVRATDDKGRTIQVSILTDDLKRAAVEIIHLMFQRWLQENDFKYLDKHFGINQITTYRSIEYVKLKGLVEDREVKSADRKALDLKLKQVTEPLKRQLLAEEQAHQAHQLRAVKGPEVAAKLAIESSTDTPEYKELRRQLVALKAADLRYETTRLERRKSIEQGHEKIVAIQVQIAGTKAQESRLEAMIQADMVKMEGQCKRLMDVLKITARNLFYQALQPFKKAYDNYRDDHDYFRRLTQCPGVMEVRAQEIVVHLMPPTNYGGELRKAVVQTLDGTNAVGLEHPCLPGRKLKFRLGQRSEMELKMNVEASTGHPE
jgi:hypothetical protein